MFINIKEMPFYKNFVPGKQLLISHIKKFLHCNIEFIDDILIKYPKCTKYKKSKIIKISKNNVLMLIYINIDENKKTIFALNIKHKNINNIIKIIEIMHPIIEEILNESYKKEFLDIILKCGTQLIRRIMAVYLCKKEKERLKILYLIELFTKLRTFSFENKQFTTGIIFSKNIKNFLNNQEIKLLKLKKEQHIGIIPKRFWFIVDGINTFFLCNKNLLITHIISYKSNSDEINYLNNIKKYLNNNNIIFSVEKVNSIHIKTNKSIEFLYNDSAWNIRNYDLIKEILKEKLELKNNVINSLFFYLNYCSLNNIGTLIWLPKNIKKIKDLIITKHRVIKEKENISILETNHFAYIIRLLQSDGVSIIDQNGTLKYFGCIIKLSKSNKTEIIGTGESVGKEISKNGIGIKVSKDGKIKIFFDPEEPYIVL